MKAKNLWWGAVALASAAVVGSAAAFGVAVHNEYKDLHHEPAYVADTPEQMLTPNPDPAPAPAAPAPPPRPPPPPRGPPPPRPPPPDGKH